MRINLEDKDPFDYLREEQERELPYPEEETEWEKHGFASEEDYWRWRLE